MDKITRRMRDGWHTYTIYTEAEARDADLAIVPWRKATPGDWALSDDGYVGKCLRVWRSKIDGHCRITLTFGVDFARSKKPMLYEKRKAEKNWSYSDKWERQKRDARRTRSRNAITAYVVMLLGGQNPDWETLGNIYRPDDGIPSFQVRRDFKKPAFKAMIQKELETVLTNQGSSPTRVVEMYNEAFEKAKEGGKPNVMVDVADRFSELWRLKDDRALNGELPEGLGNVTILEGVEADLKLATQTNGEKDG